MNFGHSRAPTHSSSKKDLYNLNQVKPQAATDAKNMGHPEPELLEGLHLAEGQLPFSGEGSWHRWWNKTQGREGHALVVAGRKDSAAGPGKESETSQSNRYGIREGIWAPGSCICALGDWALIVLFTPTKDWWWKGAPEIILPETAQWKWRQN